MNKKSKFYIPVLIKGKFTPIEVEIFHSWYILTSEGPVLMCSLTNGIRILHKNLMNTTSGSQAELEVIAKKIYWSRSTYFRKDKIYGDNSFKVEISRTEIRTFMAGNTLPIVLEN